MQRIAEVVRSGRILVSDGAWGTLLQQKGLKAGECPELWNVERRPDVLDVAKSYIAAGADAILTNSFGASRLKLGLFGLADRASELNEAAAAVSREAAGADRYVLGSIGPTGKMLLMGDVTEEELYDSFCEQAIALERGGANAACIETMAAIDEAVQAVRAVQDNTNLEIACTFTFDLTANGEYRTMMGVTPQEMVDAIGAAGADILGTNCGNGFERMIGLVAEIRAAAPGVPILVHANAGMPENKAGVDVYPDTPEMMAAMLPRLFEAGANIVGGCCGTTPDHIRAIAAEVAKCNREQP